MHFNLGKIAFCCVKFNAKLFRQSFRCYSSDLYKDFCGIFYKELFLGFSTSPSNNWFQFFKYDELMIFFRCTPPTIIVLEDTLKL